MIRRFRTLGSPAACTFGSLRRSVTTGRRAATIRGTLPLIAAVAVFLLGPSICRGAVAERELVVKLLPAAGRSADAPLRHVEAAVDDLGAAWRPAFRGWAAAQRSVPSPAPALEPIHVLSFATRAARDLAWDRLQRHPEVAYVEPVQLIRVLPDGPNANSEAADPAPRGTGGIEPGDALFPQQWALERIQMPTAWQQGTGTPGLRVGVVDTGIWLDHPDLAPNLLRNAAEEQGELGVDDDRNGYVDDIYGWDFTADGPDPSDGFGHGTHVAGIIGAASDDEFGVVGVTWDVDLIAVKMFDDFGVGTSLSGAQGIVYAVDRGADIINMSWTSFSYSRLIRDAIEYASARDVVLVGAAGNSSTSVLEFYPAALDPVITVGATNLYDGFATFSNRGARIDLVAPGVDILSTWRDRHLSLSGTSMAAPQVAGVAAHILFRHPEFTAEEVRAALTASAHDLRAQGWDQLTGAGRLDAAAATAITDPPVAVIRSPSTLDAFDGGEVAIRVLVEGGAGAFARLDIGAGDNPSDWQTLWEGGSVAETEVASFDAEGASDGDYTLRLVVTRDALVAEDRVVFKVDRLAPALESWAPVDQLVGGRFRHLVRLSASERVAARLWVRELGDTAPFEPVGDDDVAFDHTFEFVDRLPGTQEFRVELEDLAGTVSLLPDAGMTFTREILPILDVPRELLSEAARLQDFEVGVVVDLDGDGRAELLGEARESGAEIGSLVVYAFAGDPPAPRRYDTGLRGLPLAAADMNADGLIEVLVADSLQSGSDGSTILSVYNHLLGASPVLIGERDDGYRLFGGEFADINRDGRAELLYAEHDGGELRVFELHGSELVAVPVVFEASVPRVAGFAIDDFDGDGYTEVAMGTASGDVVVLEESAGVLREVYRAPLRDGLANALVASALGDTDGDGQPEFAINTVGTILDRRQRPGVSVFEASGDNRYVPTAWFEVGAKSFPFDNDLGRVDIDGDGDPEFLVAVSGAVYLIDAAGDDRFVPIWHATREAAGHVASSDLDRDGQPEIVVVELGSEGPVSVIYSLSSVEPALPLVWEVRRHAGANRVSWQPTAASGVSDLAVYAFDEPPAKQLIESDIVNQRVHVHLGDVAGAGTFLDSGHDGDALYRLAYTIDGASGRRRVLTDAMVVAPAAPETRLVFGVPTPSPFAEAMGIELELSEPAPVAVRVYDVNGRLLRVLARASFEPGRYTLAWDGIDERGQQTASGVYFLRVESPLGSITRKVIRLR